MGRERAVRRGRQEAVVGEGITHYAPPKRPGPIQAKTDAQHRYLSAIKSAQVTFGIGPAGTGKTYVAAALACDMLMDGRIERLVLTRPAVEAEESLGFLPGELGEKYAPYLEPLRAVLEQRLGAGTVKYLVGANRIVPKPLAFMRGETFENDFVILDEAQNTTPGQMKLFLTRIGEHAKVVVNGDPEQVDVAGESGLVDAVSRLQHLGAVRVVRFSESDVVRSGFVAEVIRAYRK